MKVRLISLLAKLLSLLPLSLNRIVGSLLGRLVWVARGQPRRVTESNLALCFPENSKQQHKQLAYSSLLHTGMQLTECAWIWHRSTTTSRALICKVSGGSLLDDAIGSERGLIVVSPHMGNWELFNLVLSAKTDFRYFYRSPRNKTLEPALIKWRAHLGGSPLTLDRAGIRDAMRLLKKGGTLGILPDQEPDLDSGVFVPFFNEPALTMTLLSRLASRSRANVLYAVAERLAGGSGWNIHFLKANPDIFSTDVIKSATAVNSDVERCIAISTEQYLWDYKRFNSRQDGSRRAY